MRRGEAVLVVFAGVAPSVALTSPAIAEWGKTQIQVHCYKGNRDDNRHLGTVDLFDLARPSSHCNIMYNDCQGNCTACYDDETGREVCATTRICLTTMNDAGKLLTTRL